MLRHIVMFQFKDELDERSKKESLDIAKKMLEDLMGVVPTLLNMRVDLNSQEASKDNYDLILVSEFENMEGLSEYIVHPAHKKVGEFLQKVKKLRACIDYEI